MRLVLAALAALPLQWLHMVDATHGYSVRGQYPGYHLAVTSDGGRAWADITPGSGTIHPSGSATIAGRSILFGTKRGPHTFAVERSDDGGRTWRMSQTFVDPHGLGIGAPDVVDARHLFVAIGQGAAAGSEGESLWASSDGGGTWHFVSQTALPTTGKQKPGQLPFGCDKNGYGFATASSGWATGFCAGGGPFIYRTDDGGRTWRRVSLQGVDACSCDASTPFFSNAHDGVLAVRGFGMNGNPSRSIARMYWTTDGGVTWRGTTVPSRGGRADGAVSIVDSRTVWLAGTHRGALGGPWNRLFRTSDAGRGWQTVSLPFDAAKYQLDAVDATTAFAYGSSILETTDGGVHWQGLRASPRCPFGEPNVVRGSGVALVPPGATSVVLCWYGGLSTRGAAGGLVASARLMRNLVVRLTNELDALPTLPSGIHCPFDDGSAIVATFRYRNAAPSAVRIGLTGCMTAGDGRLTRHATPSVISEVERILQPNGHPGLRPAARCMPQQLGVSVQTQGENTTAWIGVTVQNRGAACVAKRVPVTVAVPGSRLTLHVTATLAHGGTRLLVADWSNWCGSRRGVEVTAEAGEAAAVAPVRPLPVCLQRRQPSVLAPVH